MIKAAAGVGVEKFGLRRVRFLTKPLVGVFDFFALTGQTFYFGFHMESGGNR